MNVKSEKVITQKSAKELFEILSEVKNFEKLMPKEKTKFELKSHDSFLFAIKGTPDIEVQLKEKNANKKLVFQAISKVPFTLSFNIEDISTSSSAVQLFFHGKFNPMISMMIKGPINNLVNMLAENTIKL